MVKIVNREIFLASNVIKYEEGLRLVPYYCTEGYPTIGWGEVIGKQHDPLPDIVWTIDQAQQALDKKLTIAIKELSTNKVTKPVWVSLGDDTDRKSILISMWYQLGIDRLSGFKNTLAAILEKDWQKASDEMLDSKVARSTAIKRWKRQSNAMLTGDVLSTYKF